MTTSGFKIRQANDSAKVFWKCDHCTAHGTPTLYAITAFGAGRRHYVKKHHVAEPAIKEAVLASLSSRG